MIYTFDSLIDPWDILFHWPVFQIFLWWFFKMVPLAFTDDKLTFAQVMACYRQSLAEQMLDQIDDAIWPR